MRGIVFELFEAFVVERRGEDAYEELLDAVAGRLATTEPYLGILDYPSDDLETLATAEARARGLEPAVLLVELGEFCIPRLARRYAWAFAGQRSLGSFLAYLHRTAAGRGELEVGQTGAHIAVSLAAPPALSALGEGLLAGLAHHFGKPYAIEPVSHAEDRCAWKLVEA